MNARRLATTPVLLFSVLLLVPTAAVGEPPASPFADAVRVSPFAAPEAADPTPLHAPPEQFPFGFGQAPAGLQQSDGAVVASVAPGVWAFLQLGLSVYGTLALAAWLAALAWAMTGMRSQWLDDPLDRRL